MSSRGTRIYTFRLPEALMIEVEATRKLRNEWTREEPWSLSDFVRIALQEKVRKMNRSRKRPICEELVGPLTADQENDASPD